MTKVSKGHYGGNPKTISAEEYFDKINKAKLVTTDVHIGHFHSGNHDHAADASAYVTTTGSPTLTVGDTDTVWTTTTGQWLGSGNILTSDRLEKIEKDIDGLKKTLSKLEKIFKDYYKVKGGDDK